MKLLKVAVDGLPLFRGKLEIDFAATQRVDSRSVDSMYPVFGKIHQNNTIAVVGINASGKTSVLKVMTFAMGMLRSSLPINSLPCCEVLDALPVGQKAVFRCYFYSSLNQFHCLKTVISRNKDRCFIVEEELKSKPATKTITKKAVYDFENVKSDIVRDTNEAYLLDDMSIMVAFNKRSNDPISYINMLQHTDTNQLTVMDDIPAEVIAFFDPCVEYLHIQDKKKGFDIRLKFYDKDEIVLPNVSDLNHYLSSGTIKGINTFAYAMRTFKTGGYLIVDELENHFNKEIVATLIHFYRDKKVNPNGAVLLFSTHYSELLDEFERNDDIYVVRNRGGITAQNMADILKRNDIKKSEAYDSGFLEGTVPVYESYLALKKILFA